MVMGMVVAPLGKFGAEIYGRWMCESGTDPPLMFPSVNETGQVNK